MSSLHIHTQEKIKKYYDFFTLRIVVIYTKGTTTFDAMHGYITTLILFKILLHFKSPIKCLLIIYSSPLETSLFRKTRILLYLVLLLQILSL